MVIRPACAAGNWYPADADELITSIAELLLAYPVANFMPHALVVPHRTLGQSGMVSAAAFRHLSQLSSIIDRVVVIAAAEEDCKDAVLPICEVFSTPLGQVSLATNDMKSLSLLPFVSRSDRSHYYSARIEIQLPFLQTCLTDFDLLPILVGDLAPEDLLLLFNSFPNDRSTLIVLSVDVPGVEVRSSDKGEQRLIKSFMQYCQQCRWQIKTAAEPKELVSTPEFTSFIVH